MTGTHKRGCVDRGTQAWVFGRDTRAWVSWLGRTSVGALAWRAAGTRLGTGRRTVSRRLGHRVMHRLWQRVRHRVAPSEAPGDAPSEILVGVSTGALSKARTEAPSESRTGSWTGSRMGAKEAPTWACARGCLGSGRMDLERGLERAGVVLMGMLADGDTRQWTSAPMGLRADGTSF